MDKSTFNRALLQSLVVGLVLAGSSACSRADRADPGAETNDPAVTAGPATQRAATVTSDTGTAGTTNPTGVSPRGETSGADQGVSGYQPMARDTVQSDTGSQTGAGDNTDTVAVGDSARIGKTGERLEGTRTSEQANEDTLESQSDTARIRPPEDTSETSGAAVGSSEMARDTDVAVAQGDTLVQAETSVQPAAADTAAVSVAETQAADTSALQVSVDTSTTDQQTEVAVQNQSGMESAVADTAVVVGDSAEAGKSGERLEPEVATAESDTDTLGTDTDPIRPPEDSTEVLGNVADGESRDTAEVAAAGVESTGNAVTGANAVAQMTRQGQDCSVVSGREDVRWDMALSPATLNPCGTGTMTLPRVVTGR